MSGGSRFMSFASMMSRKFLSEEFNAGASDPHCVAHLL